MPQRGDVIVFRSEQTGGNAYIKRVIAGTFKAQKRGGIGVKGHSMRDEDEIMALIPARTLNTVLFFSDRGKVYSSKAYRIPEASRTSRGLPVVNVLEIDPQLNKVLILIRRALEKQNLEQENLALKTSMSRQWEIVGSNPKILELNEKPYQSLP